MNHPLIPQIIEFAAPVASQLGLELVEVQLHTHQSPPLLRISIRNLHQDTSLADCERLSRTLELTLEGQGLPLDRYVLEVSSPGVSQLLTTDRDFTVFKGFVVKVTAPFMGEQEWIGQLLNRQAQGITLSRKGRRITIPEHLVSKVELWTE